MAELTKPQYSNPKSYPSDRKIYQVQPARSDFARPSEVPDQMFAVANVFKALGEGIDNYQTLYKQSEDTANQLQARDLINQKIKHTANLKELLALHLPNTKYQDLKLGDVIKKVRTMDLENRSDLNIGATNEHNISIMQMPENLSPEVKAMVEDTFIRQDVDFMSSLMGQVENVQSNQSAIVLSQMEMDAKQGWFQDYHTANNLAQGRERAHNRRATLHADIDSIAKTLSWTPLEIADKKIKAGQLLLQEEFKYLYHKKPTSTRDAKQTREDAIDMATRGEINFVDKDNNIVKLDSDFYRDYVYTHKERERQIDMEKGENELIEEQQLRLENDLRLLRKKEDFNFWNERTNLIGKGRYSRLSNAFIFRQLHKIELDNKNKKATDAERKLNIKLNDKLSILTDELGLKSNFEGNIGKYATQVKDKGRLKWEPKSEKELKKITGVDNFEKRFIRDYITAYYQDKDATGEMLAVAQSNSDTAIFVGQQEQRLDSLDAIASFMDDFAMGYGKNQWKVDDSKLEEGTEGARLLSELTFDKDPKFRNATRDQILHAKKHILQGLIDKAVKENKRLYQKLIDEQKGAEVDGDDMIARKRAIAGSYHENHGNMLKNGVESYTNTVGSWKGKKPNLVQATKLKAYRLLLDKITDFTITKKRYDLRELSDRINDLMEYKINGSKINPDFRTYVTTYRDKIVNDLNTRRTQLLTDTRNTGFKETLQQAYFEEHDKYDVDEYLVWLMDRGIQTKRPQVLSSDDITNIKNMKKGSIDNLYEIVQSWRPMVDAYGDKHSRGYKIAMSNLLEHAPNDEIRAFIMSYVDARIPASKDDMDELYIDY